MYRSAIRILVADGESATRKSLHWHLEDAGYEVIPAACAGDVLLQCELQPPDVIILDVRLPDMDGYELCGRLRSDPETTEIPIIMTTDAVDSMTRSYLSKMVEFAGGDYFVAKPCDANVLVHLVRDIAPGATSGLQCSVRQFPTRVVWPTSRLHTLTQG